MLQEIKVAMEAAIQATDNKLAQRERIRKDKVSK